MSIRVKSVVTFVLLCCCCMAAVEAGCWRQQKKESIEPHPAPAATVNHVPHVHYLVEMIGMEMYNAVNRPKYKFYIYMTIDKLPDEQSTIAALATLCNILYGCCIWLGFMCFGRERMLIATALTLYIGPAIILILIGGLGLTIAAFAIYPVYSVLVMWTWFFLTSQAAQVLGQYLGLDSDADGDVDILDLVHYMGSTRLGKMLGMRQVYIMNHITRDPFQEINQRLDHITETIEAELRTGVPTKKGYSYDKNCTKW